MYKNDKIGFLVSKYGGKLISLILQALHEISISDPFTSVKAFDSKILKSLSLNKKGFDLEFEIIHKTKKNYFFFEVPVFFKPRKSNDEKNNIDRRYKMFVFFNF